MLHLLGKDITQNFVFKVVKTKKQQHIARISLRFMVNKTTITKNHGPCCTNRRDTFFALVRVRFYFPFRIFFCYFFSDRYKYYKNVSNEKNRSKKDNALLRGLLTIFFLNIILYVYILLFKHIFPRTIIENTKP